MNAAFLTLWGWPTSYSHWTQHHDCCGSFCPLRPKIGIPAIARQYIRVRGDAPNGLWVCWRPDGSVYCVSGIPKQLPLKNRLQHSGPRPTPSQPSPRAAARPAWPASLQRTRTGNPKTQSKAKRAPGNAKRFQDMFFKRPPRGPPPNSYRLSPGHGIISSCVCGYMCVQPLVNRIYASTTTFVNTRTPTMGATIMENDRCMSFYY